MAGAIYLGNNRTKFRVWAPDKINVMVVFENGRNERLHKDSRGYWMRELSEVPPGSLYKFQLGKDEIFPDPASRSQPQGVHSWSQVIDQFAFKWSDSNWKGIPLEEMIIYELHVGTFSPQGTFEGVISKLDHLLDLGINTIELMPIAQFPGTRNWGYDGVYPYAVQDNYGGSEGLKYMIDVCHQNGIAVLLDTVYNHLGPEGNYLSQYGPYFTQKYHTPWGSALNFDDKYSDEVRRFFLENALMWLEDYHLDGLRLDAVHEIIDRGAIHFLKELSLKVDEFERRSGRHLTLIAESDLNDIKIVSPYEKGGFGLEGQWVDDFHHSLHTVLTGEKDGYYKDFGSIAHLTKSLKQGFVYDGVYSDFRERTVGNKPTAVPHSKFVVSIQNHDQVGNRILGDRLSTIVDFEKLKLAAGFMLISPFVPMLFMGEEFAEKRPFHYFVSHSDPELVNAVRKGRKREFEYFFKQEAEEFPDPFSSEIFNDSKLNWDFKKDIFKKTMCDFYKKLISLKKSGEFKTLDDKKHFITSEDHNYILIKTEEHRNLLAVFNFNAESLEIQLPEDSDWNLILASAAKQWGGQATFNQLLQGGEQTKIPGFSILLLKQEK